MKNIQSLLALLCLLVISGCASTRKEPLKAYLGSTLPFGEADVEGWRYDLVSSTRTFSISFSKGGYAPAIIGSGNVLAAPAYRWKIDEDRCLIISDDEGPMAAYQLISATRATVSVWDKVGGNTEVFTRKKES